MLLSLRKLKEAASEASHARRLDRLTTAATHAITTAVESGDRQHSRDAAHPRRMRSRSASHEYDAPDAKTKLRGVAEVNEAERDLRSELRATEAANASVVDRLAAVKAAIGSAEHAHNHQLRGKVRYLLRQTVTTGGVKEASQPQGLQPPHAQPAHAHSDSTEYPEP